MKNKFKMIAVFMLAIYISSIFVILLSVPASAVSQYNGKIWKVVSTSTDATASATTTLPNGIYFTINDAGASFTKMEIRVASRDTVSLYAVSATGTYRALSVDDVLYFSADIRNITLTTFARIRNQCLEEIPIWESNDSSPYTSIYTTLSHYIFADDFTNVPFGDMWITCASVIGCLLICGLPFLVVWWLIRRI